MTYFVSYCFYYQNRLIFENVIANVDKPIKNARDIDDLNDLIWSNLALENMSQATLPTVINFIPL